ncbi:MAG: Ig-like domain-containing protein [Treponema sp.]|nr:Ig-like domain-containing protein [Treponema sp.]
MNKNTHSSISRSIKSCLPVVLAIALFSSLFLSSCEYWNEPVRGYFEKWTKEVAIDRFEFDNVETYNDKNDSLCISSNQDASIILIMQNPYHYENITVSPTNIQSSAQGSFPSVTQDPVDPTLLHFTYSQAFLEANDCGGSIGATITLLHPVNGTSKEFTFELKCNSRPPSIKGQNIQVYDNKYYLCFYIPSDELSSIRHACNTHTVYINGQAVASGTVEELTGASQARPSTLDPLTGYPAFSGILQGYTPFYYSTNTSVNTGDNMEWSVYLEDNDGLRSKTVTASTIVNPATVTISGNDLLDLTDEGKTGTLTAEIDEGDIRSWTWISSDSTIVNVTGSGNNAAAITARKGGTAVITATAELTDGRIFFQTKTIHVLDLEFAQNSPEDFLKGQTDIALSVDASGFPETPTLTWETDNHSIATVDNTGKVDAIAKGSTTLTVSASYGGKTVSETKDLFVHELSISGGNELFVGGSPLTLTAEVSSPDGRTRPQNLSLAWYSVNSATVASVNDGSVTAIGEGHSVIFVDATLNGNRLDYAAFTTVYVYDLSIKVNPPTSKNNLNSSTTTDGKAVYALPKLSDAFTFEVTNQGSFPSGTSYTWTINGTTLTGAEQEGPSVTVAPNSMLGTVGKSPSNKTQWTVSCKATLPSGLGSPVESKLFYIYELVIPTMKISTLSYPADLPKNSSGAYYVGTQDTIKKFKFKAEPSDSSAYMPSGATYTWTVNSTQLASGENYTQIEKTITNLLGYYLPPSAQQNLTITCTVSLTDCSPQTPNTSIKLAPPKTFPDPSSIDNQISCSFSKDSYGAYEVNASNWNDNFTFYTGLDLSSLPTGTTYKWRCSPGSSTYTGTGTCFYMSIKNLCGGGDTPQDYAASTTWPIYCTLSCPGYEDKRIEIPLWFVYSPD